ncbi:MAG: hypothetical protein ABFC24_10670 [Methanoregulaceae archaeon]
MDRILKTVISLFLVVLLIFSATTLYEGYVRSSFQGSLDSTYTFTVSISTDTPLTNATFFIPLPVRPDGKSPVVNRIGIADEAGLPKGWHYGIYEAGNATLVKITAPKILPEGPSEFTIDVPAGSLIDTIDPLQNDMTIQPIHELQASDCSVLPGQKTASSECSRYLGVIYADYNTTPEAKVLIHADLQGKNRWNVFHPSSNMYTNSISLTLLGNMNHGWFPAKGELISGIGEIIPAS